MKPTTPEKKPEDKSVLQKELEAAATIHEALLTVAPERREPILKAVCVLLNIYTPSV